MHPTRMRTALAGAAVAAATLLATVGLASAQGAATGTPASSCDNPTLNANLAGWGKLVGATPFRYGLYGTAGEHVNASGAYVQANNPAANPRAFLPATPVKAGVAEDFRVDTRTDANGRARVEVDWYNSANTFLGHTNGPWKNLAAGHDYEWRTLAGEFTPPAGAARANVLAGSELPAGADFSLTGCSYLPAGAGTVDPPVTTDPPVTDPPETTEPPATTEPPTTTTPPPASDSAAQKNGWGAPIAAYSDEFNYTGAPNASKWSMPSSKAQGCWAGHAGNGRRCADNTTVNGSAAVMTGEANGDTGWLRSKQVADYGRWEVRSRSYSTASSGNPYHILHLIWPSSENWPGDGEYDWFEVGSPDGQCAEAWLHYPHPNMPVQQEHATKCGVDITQWHNYAFDWTPQGITGYIDGVQFFHYSGGAGPGGRRAIQDMQPAGRYTMQADNFYGSGMQPAKFEMDWFRTYTAG